MNGRHTLTRWGFAVRGLITVILGVGGVVFAALPLAIVVAAVVYVAAGVGSLWQLAQRRNKSVASLMGRADLLLRREIIWVYLIIAVGYEYIALEGVLLRGALAATTGALVYLGGVCTQIVRRQEERPISYRKYLEQYTADQNN